MVPHGCSWMSEAKRERFWTKTTECCVKSINESQIEIPSEQYQLRNITKHKGDLSVEEDEPLSVCF